MANLRHHATQHALDAVKGGPVLGFWTAWFWGVNWTVIGAFLAALYTFILILDKVGALAPMRAWVVNGWRGLFRARP